VKGLIPFRALVAGWMTTNLAKPGITKHAILLELSVPDSRERLEPRPNTAESARRHGVRRHAVTRRAAYFWSLNLRHDTVNICGYESTPFEVGGVIVGQYLSVNWSPRFFGHRGPSRRRRQVPTSRLCLPESGPLVDFSPSTGRPECSTRRFPARLKRLVGDRFDCV
jgi:hypothetical protein